MLKDPKFEKYLYLAFAGFGAIAMSILFFFFLFELPAVMKYAGIIVDTLMPFIYGGVLAYLLYPINRWIEERLNVLTGEKAPRLCKYVGIFGGLILFGIVIYLLLWMVLPQFIDSVKSVVIGLPNTVDNLAAWIEKLLADNEPLREYAETTLNTSYAQLESWMTNSLVPGAQALIAELSGSVIATVMGVFDFVIGIIVYVYILSSLDRFRRQTVMIVQGLFPKKAAAVIFEIANETDQCFGGFIRGKILDSLIIGIICFVGTTLLKFPYATLVSVIVGVTNVIPFFGPFIGAIPSAVLILTVSPLQCLYFLIFVFLLQQLDGNVIGPTILGQSTGVGSIWVLFSILIFGKIFGVVGMIIGVPFFSVLYYLFSKLVFRKLREKGMEDTVEDYRSRYPDKRAVRDEKALQKNLEQAEKLDKWKTFREKREK